MDKQSTVVSVENVTKRFSEITAADRVSFTVPEGGIFSLLGPNGAGKTTVVRMMLGIFPPDSGRIRFNPSVVGPDKQRVGYLPEERGVYTDQSVEKVLTYFGRLHGMERASARKSVSEWLERFDLLDRAKDKVQTLSKGNQQKVQFISAVLHNPGFLILDEPFSGLDPINQQFFVELIRELASQGSTILLSAHQMELVEQLASDIVLMNNGRAVAGGAFEDLKQQSGLKHTLSVRMKPLQAEVITQLKTREYLIREEGSFHQVDYFLDESDEAPQALKYLFSQGEVVDVHLSSPSLHSIYLALVKASQQQADTGKEVTV